MKLLACLPGASYSTLDVATGLLPELRNLGIEIVEYDLESRLDLSGRWLNMVWRGLGKPKENKYTRADVIYGAAKDAIERALWHDVDGVLIFSGMFFPKAAAILFRRAGIRTAALLSESPYDTEKEVRWVDAVDVAWTNERSSVRQLRTANPNVNYMPHAFNPAVHHPESDDDPDVPVHDVVFVGSMFEERVALLSAIDWTGIDFGLYGEWSGLDPSRDPVTGQFRPHKLRQHLRGGVTDNRKSAALYRKAKIGLNLYRESMGWGRDTQKITHAESMNPRTLELAACGCFQISQARDEITEVFGDSVATFSTAGELEQQIRWALAHPEDRADAAGLARCAVQPHTFAARARTIVADLGRAGWPVPQREAVAV